MHTEQRMYRELGLGKCPLPSHLKASQPQYQHGVFWVWWVSSGWRAVGGGGGSFCPSVIVAISPMTLVVGEAEHTARGLSWWGLSSRHKEKHGASLSHHLLLYPLADFWTFVCRAGAGRLWI